MKLIGMHHVRFDVPDLARTEAFATDFGLVTVERTADRLVMRARGVDSYAYIAQRADAARFVGFAIAVESAADLDRAVTEFGATDRRALDTPGCGEAVSLTDPDGNCVDLVHDIAPRQADPVPTPDLAANSPAEPVRHGESQYRRDLGPAHLFRLGHIGLFVRDFATSAEWYTRVLGMIGSDVYHVPHDPSHNIVGFMRLDRGDQWVDHHMVALMQRETPDCHHISFEVQDFEAQFVAHRFLKTKGYESIWGVGRHPHGSHIFDVWRDPDGWRFETFSDTDLLTAARPTRFHNVKDVEMDIWSSDPPDRYFA
jgi:catechol 2,3-dioxygenase-like lactoylglutathione lyase family enzyme